MRRVDLLVLGDSFSSGLGAGRELTDWSWCRRTDQSWGMVLGTRRGWHVDVAACRGATIRDVDQQARSAPTIGTARRVALTVSGNDGGFARVLLECAKPQWWGDADAALDRAEAWVRDELPHQLTGMLQRIRAMLAPDAERVLLGYPRLFAGLDCHQATFFTEPEMTRLNAATDRLVERLQEVADHAGWLFVDVRDRFEGHAACTPRSWINPVTLRDPGAAFHPNAAGHLAYADALEEVWALEPMTSRAPAPPVVRGLHGGLERRPVSVVPNLESAAARHASAEAGLSPEHHTALARAQAGGASNTELLAMG